MRFEQLNCLVEIEKAGSITGAAQKLFITQQAVSLNIKQLEKELDAPLLIRNKNGVQLTDNGKKTVAFAKAVLQEKEKLLNELTMKEVDDQRPIVEYKICSTSAVINYVLPTVFSDIEVREQKIRVNITNADSIEDILQQIADGKRELGLISINKNELLNQQIDEQFGVEILCYDEVVAVFHKRLFERHGNNQNELWASLDCSYPKTLYNIIPGKAYREMRDDYVACSTDVGFHRNMLEKHEAVAFMPRLAYDYFFSSKRYMALSINTKEHDNAEFSFVHIAIYRKNNQKVQELVKHIQKEINAKQA